MKGSNARNDEKTERRNQAGAGAHTSDNLALMLRGVCKSYPKFELKDVTFSLPRGFIMGFIGPNGAGKTTTIKIIMNMARKSRGTVKALGLDHRLYEKEVKRRIGYVGEEPRFYEEMTPLWFGGFVSKYYPTWDKAYFDATLDRFGIDPAKRVKDLSKGMKVKLGLALALSHKPELLILDEPTSGLDPVIRRDVLDELMSVIQDEKRSVFFSTHITQDIERIADYVTFIHEGRIVESDVKDDILGRWKSISFPLPVRAGEAQGSLRTGAMQGTLGTRDLEADVAKATAYVERMLDQELQGVFIGHKIEGLTFSGITSAFSSTLEGKVAQLIGSRPRVAPVSLDDILVAIVRGNNAC
jgi:ABC-2 type transport system ATP-binding protein